MEDPKTTLAKLQQERRALNECIALEYKALDERIKNVRQQHFSQEEQRKLQPLFTLEELEGFMKELNFYYQ